MTIKRINRKVFLLLLLSIGLIVSGTILETAAQYLSRTSQDQTVNVATWNFKINNQSTSTLAINLKDTVIPNNYGTGAIIPGSEGVIPFNIDATDTKVVLDYKIVLDSENTVLPPNLKLYVDNTYQTEFTELTGTINLDSTKKILENIYWKWDYTEENETESWTNQDIKISLKATAEQKIEEG